MSRNTPGSGSTNWPMGPAKLGAAKRNFESASTPSQRLMETYAPDQPLYGHSSDPVGHETLTSYVNQQVVIMPKQTPETIFERPTVINIIFEGVPVAHIQNGEMQYEMYPLTLGDRLSSYGLPGSGRHFTITSGFTASMEGLKFDYDAMATDIPAELDRIDNEFLRIFSSQELGVFCLAMYQCTASGGAHFEKACIKQDHMYDADSMFCKANELFAAFNRDPIKAMNDHLHEAGNIFGIVRGKVEGSLITVKTDNLLRNNPYYHNYSESGPGAKERSEEPALVPDSDEVGLWAGRFRRFICPNVCIDAPGSVFQPLHNRASFGAHLTTEVRFGKTGGSALSNAHTQEVHVRRPLPGGGSEDHVLGYIDLARKNQHYPAGGLNVKSLLSIAKDGLNTLHKRGFGTPLDEVTKSPLLDPYVVGIKREGNTQTFAVANCIGEVEHTFYPDSALAKYVTNATEVVREKLNISSEDLLQCSTAISFLNANSKLDFSAYPGKSPMEEFFEDIARSNRRTASGDAIAPNTYGAPNLPDFEQGYRPWGYSTAGAVLYFSSLVSASRPTAVESEWLDQFRAEITACATLEKVATRMAEILSEIFPGPPGKFNPIFDDSRLHKFQRPANASREMLRKLTFIQNAILPVTLPFAVPNAGVVALASGENADATLGRDAADDITEYSSLLFRSQDKDLREMVARFYVSDETKDTRDALNTNRNGVRTRLSPFTMASVAQSASSKSNANRTLIGAIYIHRALSMLTDSNQQLKAESYQEIWNKAAEMAQEEGMEARFPPPAPDVMNSTAKQAENSAIGAVQDTGVLRDWIVLPLSISRSSYVTITRSTRVQPCKLTNERSELIKVSARDLRFTPEQLAVIHKMGAEHIGLYGPTDMYPELVYQAPGTGDRPPQKLADYYSLSSGNGFFDHAFEDLAIMNSSPSDAPTTEAALNSNMARRVSKIASCGDFFSRAVGLAHLGTFIQDTRFVDAAVMAGLPAPIQFLVVCPNVEMDFHGHLAFARKAGVMQYTKMFMSHNINMTTKGTVVARWCAGASVNPMLVFYNPYAHLVNYKHGKTFRLVDAGRTDRYAASHPSYTNEDPFNIMTAFTAEQSSGDTLVFTWGFGGRPQPKLLALGGPLPTAELRTLHARFSQAYQQQHNQVTPGMLYVNEMTGVMDNMVKKPTSFFGSMWDFGTSKSERVSLYTDAMQSSYLNPVTGELLDHCSGCGFLKNETDLWQSVSC